MTACTEPARPDEIANERALSLALWTARDEDRAALLARVANECSPPLAGHFTDPTCAVLALAWDAVLAGRIGADAGSIADFLSGITKAQAHDALAGKPVRGLVERCAPEDSAFQSIGGWNLDGNLGDVLRVTGGNLTAAARNLRHAADRRHIIAALRATAQRVNAAGVQEGPSGALACGLDDLAGLLGRPRVVTLGDGLYEAITEAERAAAERAAGRVTLPGWGGLNWMQSRRCGPVVCSWSLLALVWAKLRWPCKPLSPRRGAVFRWASCRWKCRPPNCRASWRGVPWASNRVPCVISGTNCPRPAAPMCGCSRMRGRTTVWCRSCPARVTKRCSTLLLGHGCGRRWVAWGCSSSITWA